MYRINRPTMPNVCATKTPSAGGFRVGSRKQRIVVHVGSMQKDGSEEELV